MISEQHTGDGLTTLLEKRVFGDWDPEQDALVKRRGTPAGDRREQCIHDIFDEQASRTPNAVAVQYAGEYLTYDELRWRANQLARYLRDCGVQPETRVGICLHRSLEMIIGLLGIFKAGGAYVPLDPAYPAERLKYMVEDAGAEVVLTQLSLKARLAGYNGCWICLDEDQRKISARSGDSVMSNVRHQNLAYLIYTSGSTGRPKGVELAHQGLVNLARAQHEAFGQESTDRILQFASLSFDASISEICMAWISGATLCLVRQEDILAGQSLASAVKEQAITVATLPPSVLNTVQPEDLSDVSCLIVAGEAISQQAASQWSIGRRLLNAYGPTETTVCATVMPVNVPVDSRPPIGTPIANTSAYILDDAMQPAAVGVAGELYIGGAGIARGYRNLPGLTAARFIPDPFSEIAGQRLYRTGDLVKRLPSGNLEFIGRADDQIKMRGYRIELGEIEAVLFGHELVAEAVVIAREINSEKRLIAYLVPSANSGMLTTKAVRSYLEHRLPEHMVPAAIVILDQLPLNANGKIERRALPDPQALVSASEQRYAPPRTSLERSLAEIWSEALAVQNVGIHDNFFEAGGYSLSATQVLSRVKQQFHVKLSMRTLYNSATLAHFTELVEQAIRKLDATPSQAS
jgi:amino acid adenylation domain-containing protein